MEIKRYSSANTKRRNVYISKISFLINESIYIQYKVFFIYILYPPRQRGAFIYSLRSM